MAESHERGDIIDIYFSHQRKEQNNQKRVQLASSTAVDSKIPTRPTDPWAHRIMLHRGLGDRPSPTNF
eukprot:scaffold825_cov147-Cylindrotheca_fusiformis.AAC.5